MHLNCNFISIVQFSSLTKELFFYRKCAFMMWKCICLIYCRRRHCRRSPSSYHRRRLSLNLDSAVICFCCVSVKHKKKILSFCFCILLTFHLNANVAQQICVHIAFQFTSDNLGSELWEEKKKCAWMFCSKKEKKKTIACCQTDKTKMCTICET